MQTGLELLLPYHGADSGLKIKALQTMTAFGERDDLPLMAVRCRVPGRGPWPLHQQCEPLSELQQAHYQTRGSVALRFLEPQLARKPMSR